MPRPTGEPLAPPHADGQADMEGHVSIVPSETPTLPGR